MVSKKTDETATQLKFLRVEVVKLFFLLICVKFVLYGLVTAEQLYILAPQHSLFIVICLGGACMFAFIAAHNNLLKIARS